MQVLTRDSGRRDAVTGPHTASKARERLGRVGQKAGSKRRLPVFKVHTPPGQRVTSHKIRSLCAPEHLPCGQIQHQSTCVTITDIKIISVHGPQIQARSLAPHPWVRTVKAAIPRVALRQRDKPHWLAETWNLAYTRNRATSNANFPLPQGQSLDPVPQPSASICWALPCGVSGEGPGEGGHPQEAWGS